jgi:hypothetical protein
LGRRDGGGGRDLGILWWRKGLVREYIWEVGEEEEEGGRRGRQTGQMAFAEEFNERGAFCGVEDGCELHLRGCVVNVVEQVRMQVADENWEFLLSRMTRNGAMGKINYDAGSNGEDGQTDVVLRQRLKEGTVWYNRYSFLKLWRRPISEVLETEKALPLNLKKVCSWY